MPRLTQLTSYADAQAHASGDALWELFDGDREALNIAHECITRHADGTGRAAVRIAHSDGADEILSFDTIAAGAAHFELWLAELGVQAGSRITARVYGSGQWMWNGLQVGPITDHLHLRTNHDRFTQFGGGFRITPPIPDTPRTR